VIVAQLPDAAAFDAELLKEIEVIKQVVSEIRNIRNTKQISPKEALTLSVKVGSGISFESYKNIIFKLTNISELSYTDEKLSGAASFLSGRDEFYVPLAGNIDIEAEKEKINKEIEYLKGFLKSVNAKLSNERFVQNAKPEVVANEQAKQADAEAKIIILEGNLASL